MKGIIAERKEVVTITAEERYPNRVLPRNAAAELGMSLEDLYWGMDNGYLQLGFVKRKPGAYKRHFVIFRPNLEAEKERLTGGGLAEAVKQGREEKNGYKKTEGDAF